MKTLEEYQTIHEFLGSQGLQPTVAMLAVQESEWKDLVFLAESWKTRRNEEIAAQRAELEGLTEEEIAQRERLLEEDARLEREKVLYHSCGYKPERK